MEAQAFGKLLQEQGAHFGTLAHADDSFTTVGVLYGIDQDGKLKVKYKLDDVQQAFYAGKDSIAIETAARLAILSINDFVGRVLNNEDVLKDDEGMAKEDNMTLVRAELDPLTPVMAAKKDDKIVYYGLDNTELTDKGETGFGENVYAFPAVDRTGKQDAATRVRFQRTGDGRGNMTRVQVAATGK
ncbi:hypothetical protein HYS28_03595 [Candidatus Uhrbacteria bacterium]|nr:hypothetical protein [Candidatus Uhrbacteria bacterium]